MDIRRVNTMNTPIFWITLSFWIFFTLSTLAWKQPGCPDNADVDVFYKTVATKPQENKKNWLCEESYELRVNICSNLFKTHILRKFDFESIKEVPEFDIRIDVRMFRCPVRIKVKDPEPVMPLLQEIARDFFITKGIANQTVALLLTSSDRKKKPNICLEDIFWYNDTDVNANVNRSGPVQINE